LWTETIKLDKGGMYTLPYSPEDPFGVFPNSVMSVSTPIFDKDQKIGIFGAHFDTDTFFVNLVDPMIQSSHFIEYWIYPADDFNTLIRTNSDQTKQPTAEQVRHFATGTDNKAQTQVEYEGQVYNLCSAYTY
jgi:hypothetical protein